MSQNKLISSPSLHRLLLDGYLPGANETSTFCAYVYECLNSIKFIMTKSSPIGQEGAFGEDQKSGRF